MSGNKIPKRITLKWLKKHGACTAAIAWFRDEFGKSGRTGRVLMRATMCGRPEWVAWVFSICNQTLHPEYRLWATAKKSLLDKLRETGFEW